MLKTPSVMIRRLRSRGSASTMARAAFASRCGKTLMVARLRRAPSMMLA